jgi:hypothetical protein
MSENKRHIDDVFRKELSGHKAEPPAEVWSRISNQLAAKKRAGLIHVFTKAAAGVAVLLGLGGGLLYFITRDSLEDYFLLPGNNSIIPSGIEMLHASGQTLTEAPAGTPPAGFPVDARHGREKTRGQEELTAIPALAVQSGKQYLPRAAEKPYLMHIPYKKPDKVISGTLPATLAIHSQSAASIRGPEEKWLSRSATGRSKRWQAGIMAAPNYSYRSLSEGTQGRKAGYNNAETGLLSLTGRITIGYRINTRISLQTGVDILTMGQGIGRLKVNNAFLAREGHWYLSPVRTPESSPALNNSLGPVQPDIAPEQILRNRNYRHETLYSPVPGSYEDIGRVVQELYYLQAPVILQYRMLNGNTGLVVSGGLGANFLAGNNVMLKGHGESVNIGKTPGLRNFSLSGILGIGLERKIGQNTGLVFEPRFTHFLTTVNPDLDHRHHPWAISFSGGIFHWF